MNLTDQIRKLTVKTRRFRCYSAEYVRNGLAHFYQEQSHDAGASYLTSIDAVTEVSKDEQGIAIECKGAFTTHPKGAPEDLERSLKTHLPEDFKELYREFGSVLLITRALPILLQPVSWMIAEFEKDPDIDIEQGCFFRFAQYPGESVYYGLRRHDFKDDWEVVGCSYGLLYREMVGPQGKENVVAPSFGEWLKRWIETDGFPDPYYPCWGTEEANYISALVT